VTVGAAHPEPPADLHSRELPIAYKTGPWVRSHAIRHDPHYFGTGVGERFDDPLGQFGVCYVGADHHCAFIETLPHGGPGIAGGGLVIPVGFLAQRGWARVTLSQRVPLRLPEPLRLVDLTGAGLTHLGADADLCSCRAYGVSQRWSRALHEHPEAPDGLLYRARHDPGRQSLALFGDRVAVRIAMARQGAWGDIGNTALLDSILQHYKLAEQPRG